MTLIPLDGSKVRDRREALGLSRDELAAQTGLGRVTLWKCETNGYKHGPQIWVAKALAEALGLRLEDIVDDHAAL